MTTLKQMLARIRRFKTKPENIVVSAATRLDLAIEIAARHPMSTEQNLKHLRKYGYGGDVRICGVRMVAADA